MCVLVITNLVLTNRDSPTRPRNTRAVLQNLLRSYVLSYVAFPGILCRFQALQLPTALAYLLRNSRSRPTAYFVCHKSDCYQWLQPIAARWTLTFLRAQVDNLSQLRCLQVSRMLNVQRLRKVMSDYVSISIACQVKC